MKVLGISSSPRPGGNSDALLDKALEGAASRGADTLKLSLRDMDIHHVSEEEYDRSADSGLSVVHDGMDRVFSEIKSSDLIIFAAPVFFGSLPSLAKAMIDRFQCVWFTRNVLGKEIFDSRKKGAFICVAGSDRKDFFDNARSIVKHFFATINADYSGDLFAMRLDKKGDVLSHPEILSQAFELGKRLAGA